MPVALVACTATASEAIPPIPDPCADAGPDDTTDLASPPSPGPAHPVDVVGSTTFAVTKLFLGDVERDGKPNEHAWKAYGFDLDGVSSQACSRGLCQPRAGALPRHVYPDGTDGRDNAFGHDVRYVIRLPGPDAERLTNARIANGDFTLLFDLQGLGAGADYTPLSSKVYRGGRLEAPPKLDGSDVWPIDPESLVDPMDRGSAKGAFPDSYLVGNVWVARGPGATIPLRITVAGKVVLDLLIVDPILSMELSSDHFHATNGTIAGILPTDALVETTRRVVPYFDSKSCEGSALVNWFVEQVEQASDVLVGAAQDPSKICDGVSIGIGFEAERVQLGDIGPAIPPLVDKCK